jgi:hypothetical protein
VTNTALTLLELAAFDPVGWHYAQQLAQRAEKATGRAQALLNAKHTKALLALNHRFEAAKTNALPVAPPVTPSPSPSPSPAPAPSPLALLLQEMTPTTVEANPAKPGAWRTESPRIQQFRKQLGQLSVKKQVSKAMAQAPQNAGPINSHMLVLRSLGLMQEASPDYLNRFMGYVDTLLCLDSAEAAKSAPRKPSSAPASKK